MTASATVIGLLDLLPNGSRLGEWAQGTALIISIYEALPTAVAIGIAASLAASSWALEHQLDDLHRRHSLLTREM